MKWQRGHIDLQAKVILVLIAVILPTFLIVTIAENKLTLPILEEEIRQMAINAGKTLAAEIDRSRLLSLPNPSEAIENALQDVLYGQPDLIRIDVITKNPATGLAKLIASNIEDDPANASTPPILVDSIRSEFNLNERGIGEWEIYVPIEHYKSRDVRGPKKLLGTIRVIASTHILGRMAQAFWRTTAVAACFSVISLILALSYFLRKTIANDRLLKQTQSQNLQLTEQLHDVQRQLMMNEKLAVMGQLTARFAHEVGTPLNALGGHLQLLEEEVTPQFSETIGNRFEVISGQLRKIEDIVKGFLQSTSKPPSRKQLTDLNALVDKALGIVLPRLQSLNIEVHQKMDRDLTPLRVVPIDFEQALLNLLNNSVDSLRAKRAGNRKNEKSKIELSTRLSRSQGKKWALISVFDNGEGIRKANLEEVLKPFFTTKRPGEGTGLGLTICQQLVQKYGGNLKIDSKEGAWTRVTLELPFEGNT